MAWLFARTSTELCRPRPPTFALSHAQLKLRVCRVASLQASTRFKSSKSNLRRSWSTSSMFKDLP
eukprot:6447208-Heterocapsa_arctica.AAC.1